MLELKAEARQRMGKKTNRLRQNGQIPAVLYGHNIKSLPLTVVGKEFGKVFKQAGETSILQLAVGSKKHNVLIHDLARDPFSDKVIHIDFYEVRMDEKLKTKIPLVFVGESPAIKAEGGVLVRAIQEVEVEALPADLPKEISVDISSLNTFEDKICIRDLKISEKVKIFAESSAMVAAVAPPRSEEELKEMEAKSVEEIGEIKVVGEEEKAAKAAEVAAQAEAVSGDKEAKKS